ncbi:MAG: 3-phosphoshikimate 1-carboxyvinyltransferase, partial [Planctomycetes bacterium]|nr:3-phosphoshikimate 1-carboxyvinyltransferase [Planctomycetota bacterium]
MQLKVGKSRLKGSVSVPASKSHTIRAVAVASLAKGQSRIINPLISSDSVSAANCYKALGADIDTTDKTCWKVTGTGGNIKPPADIIDVGNSGTTLRIAAGSAALVKDNNKIRFTGDEQIQSRPIGPLLDSLSDLGAKAVSIKDNGKAPIEITGTLNGGQTTLECVTSQYLSSLLLCCPLAAGDSEINVTLLNEPDYVQMTLDWLDKQGIKYQNDKMKKFIIQGNQSYSGFELPVPADFSSATFFLCAAALMGDEVILTGLDFNDSQPDKAVVDYLKAMG